jgi:DNA-binding transcriptional MocR family regulator
MFLWMELLGIEDVSDVWEDLQREGVIVCPGSVMKAPFAANQGWKGFSDAAEKSPFIRISFSGATDADLMAAMKRIASVLKRRSLL